MEGFGNAQFLRESKTNTGYKIWVYSGSNNGFSSYSTPLLRITCVNRYILGGIWTQKKSSMLAWPWNSEPHPFFRQPVFFPFHCDPISLLPFQQNKFIPSPFHSHTCINPLHLLSWNHLIFPSCFLLMPRKFTSFFLFLSFFWHKNFSPIPESPPGSSQSRKALFYPEFTMFKELLLPCCRQWWSTLQCTVWIWYP